MGLVRTVPEGMEPGSDIANMSLLGYDPRAYHTGRGPLEAASMGVRLGPEEVAFRCNLVTLEADGSGIERMVDYSAGHISSAEAHELVEALQQAVEGTPLRLFAGVSYRHLLVWPGGPAHIATTPPHDITGEPTASYRQVYEQTPVLDGFRRKAREILAGHRVNRERQAGGKRPANSVWPWGQGRAPSMPTIGERLGLSGAMISAVDLLKGIGVYAGLTPIPVAGATGYLDTNYAGKVAAGLHALETGDLLFLHIEAPDEAGHEGSLEKKIQAIEDFDRQVVGPMLVGLRRHPRVRLLIVTDHFTPVHKRTHTSDPTPFLLVEDLPAPIEAGREDRAFCESAARAEGLLLESGVALFDRLIGRV
jgi:2,3-bisphosphoglycerate-independent phosphoglycerate mutase